MRAKPSLRGIGSKRFWSAAGAVLSVFATLWATLIGRTVPQILASSPSSPAAFLRAANRACSALPAAPGFVVPGPGGRAELPRVVAMRSPGAINRIDNDFGRRAYEPLEGAASGLLALTAPAPYAAEYRTFEQLFGDTVFAFDRLRETIDRLEVQRSESAYRRTLGAVLDANLAVFERVQRLSERGELLRLNECVVGLNGIATQLEFLNGDIM